ncbi:MAG: NADH-quinone oxidoreductase subunit NuoE [Legionellales bacterium]|jgi:NADH-quinone oxidoreductase subunit E|nr:NADH-quinone oxidoreductase subunit NuoE [Legionellales bacterium]
MSNVNLDGFPAKICTAIDKELAKYPADKKRSAVLMSLRIVQDEYGYLYRELLDNVASYLGISYIEVYEVASFYSMYKLKPTGKYHIKVCNSISCSLCGSGKILQHLVKKLGINIGQTTSDGKFTLDYAECLAACSSAPVMIVNDKTYHENLTEDKVDEIIVGLEKELSTDGN